MLAEKFRTKRTIPFSERHIKFVERTVKKHNKNKPKRLWITKSDIYRLALDKLQEELEGNRLNR